MFKHFRIEFKKYCLYRIACSTDFSPLSSNLLLWNDDHTRGQEEDCNHALNFIYCEYDHLANRAVIEPHITEIKIPKLDMLRMLKSKIAQYWQTTFSKINTYKIKSTQYPETNDPILERRKVGLHYIRIKKSCIVFQTHIQQPFYRWIS